MAQDVPLEPEAPPPPEESSNRMFILLALLLGGTVPGINDYSD